MKIFEYLLEMMKFDSSWGAWPLDPPRTATGCFDKLFYVKFKLYFQEGATLKVQRFHAQQSQYDYLSSKLHRQTLIKRIICSIILMIYFLSLIWDLLNLILKWTRWKKKRNHISMRWHSHGFVTNLG